jgi:sugar lactone lactonase YvrE
MGGKAGTDERLRGAKLLRGSGARAIVAAALGLLALTLAAAGAPASDGWRAPPLPSSDEVVAAIDAGDSASFETPMTNSSAAEALPHENLNRGQALELLESVFAVPLQAPVGIYDDLDVERFLAPNVAVVPSHGGSSELLLSSTPLGSGSDSGGLEAVDLSLERSSGEVTPANPLVEVGIPQALGEGIELPGPGVTIRLMGAPESRSTSIGDPTLAFLPNVGPNTDLAIVPTPTGVEAFTQIRSAASPHTQTFELDLPAGAELRASPDGGAVVEKEGRALVGISPPTAMDATGTSLPVSLQIQGNRMTLTTSFDETTPLPILVDPLVQSYEWMSKNTTAGIPITTRAEGWSSEFVEGDNQLPFGVRLENRAYGSLSPVPTGTPGLFLQSSRNGSGAMTTGDRGSFMYTVPRYFTDYENLGTPPTSFISQMTLSGLDWNAFSSRLSPYLFAGIWDPIKPGWVSYYSHEGLSGHGVHDMSWQYRFPATANVNTNVKVGYVSIQATETGTQQNTEAYVGTASVQLADNGSPGFGAVSGPSGWLHASAPPIVFTASDTGLGVQALVAGDELSGGLHHEWKTSQGCVGVAGSPCPRTWNSTDTAQPSVKYDPGTMPQGVSNLKLAAQDPVQNQATASIPLKIDHTPPVLDLSGTLTEQGSTGTLRPEYSLNVKASDGDVAAPEALAPVGPAGTGEAVPQRPLGVAADGKGKLYVVDRENNRVIRFTEDGRYLGQFGSTGTGDGQFMDPRGIAVTAGGDVWVSDSATGRIQKFSPTGQFLGTFGTKGDPDNNTGLKFREVYGLATGPNGALWVVDAGGRRVTLFEETSGGVKFKRYAYNGTPASGQPALGTPIGIATDPAGNAWVVDSAYHRVQAFSAAGSYLTSFGSEGTGNGQLRSPVGVAVAPSGHLLVTDAGNNRVQVFMPTGSYLRQFGTTGGELGQLSEPRGIAIGAGNRVFVADAGNRRTARWAHGDLDRQAGTVSSTIKVDGKIVDSSSPGCTTQACAIGRSWTYKSSAFATGQHTVEVTATDAVGLTRTRSFAIVSVNDTTPPQLNLNGSLFTAPEGWVEQKSYGYQPVAQDAAGYGVVYIALKIDDKVVVSSNQACPNGGCTGLLWNALDVAQYEGGAHPAELVALDAAGNVARHTWTMNVDPKGAVSATEATATLEALDATSPANAVGEAREETSIYGTVPGLAVREAADGFAVVGSAAPTTIAADSSQGVTVETLPDGALADPCGEESSSPEEEAQQYLDPEEGPVRPSCEIPAAQDEEFQLEPVEVTPLQSAAGTTSLAGDDAAVAANTGTHVDTVTRPLYEGALTFEAIRDAAAPQSFSWRVDLDPDQELKLLDSEHAAVYYEGGHPAFGIAATPAHDAVGAAVPTSLEVSGGNVLTLNVQHRSAAFVYPVLGGVGWQGGFVTTTIEGPKDEQELREERERIEREEREAREAESGGGEVTSVLLTDRYGVIRVKAEGPPVAVASASGPDAGWAWMTHAKKFNFRECYYESSDVPTPELRIQLMHEAEHECVNNVGWRRLDAKLSVHGWFRTNRAIERVWIASGNLHCDKWGHSVPALVDCEKRPDQAVKRPNAIELYGDYRFWPGDGPAYLQPIGGPGISACTTVRGAIEYGSGTNAREAVVSPARQGDPCDWP